MENLSFQFSWFRVTELCYGMFLQWNVFSCLIQILSPQPFPTGNSQGFRKQARAERIRGSFPLPDSGCPQTLPAFTVPQSLLTCGGMVTSQWSHSLYPLNVHKRSHLQVVRLHTNLCPIWLLFIEETDFEQDVLTPPFEEPFSWHLFPI